MLAESPKVTRYTRVFQRLCYLRRRSGCFRLERPVAGWDSHPLKNGAFHGTRIIYGYPGTLQQL